MLQRLLTAPKNSFFLFGPRGSGKSTWAKKEFAGQTFVNLLFEREFTKYLVNPDILIDELRPLRANSWVVIDEVQKVPALLNSVHYLIEESKLRFCLTGSSARKLKKGAANLLGGRAVTRTMFPFLPEELGKAFSLKAALTFGTLPLVQQGEDKEDILSSYVQTYLREEIQAEALTKNLPGFARFLKIAGLFHGQALNVSNVAREAEVARNTVQSYFEILEDTLLANRLEAFSSRLRVREKSHPKFYFVDPGVVNALRGRITEPSAEQLGPLFEGFVFTMLRAYQQRDRIFDQINYWSPAEAKNTEVDFLLARGRKHIAIEVKAKEKWSTTDLKGLIAISALPSVKRRILITLGKTKMLTETGIEIIPFSSFCKELENKKL